MTNKIIRDYAIEHNVYLWQIAKKLGVTDSTFSRKLRDEFDDETKSKILSIIDEIAREQENYEWIKNNGKR